jgi:hypothetical protein
VEASWRQHYAELPLDGTYEGQEVMSASKYVVLPLVLICFVAVLGCSKVTDRSQVVGTYEAHHQNGVETLQLRSDRTYTHRFKAVDGTETAYSGKWEFEPYHGEPKVSLNSFSHHFPPNSHKEPIGITLLGIEKDWGRVRLYLSYDQDQYYSQKAVSIPMRNSAG